MDSLFQGNDTFCLFVIPMQTGIHSNFPKMDSLFRGNDTFCLLVIPVQTGIHSNFPKMDSLFQGNDSHNFKKITIFLKKTPSFQRKQQVLSAKLRYFHRKKQKDFKEYFKCSLRLFSY
jgi:hypothetical protein